MPQAVFFDREKPTSSECQAPVSEQSKVDKIEMLQDRDYSRVSSTMIREGTKDIYRSTIERDSPRVVLTATDQPSLKLMNTKRIASTANFVDPPNTLIAGPSSNSSVYYNFEHSDIDTLSKYGELAAFDIPDPEVNSNFSNSLVNEGYYSNLRSPMQISGIKSCKSPFILATREEGSELNSTQKIEIRTARYSSGGVSIPNFYSISSSDEESEPEVNSLVTKHVKAISVKEPIIRSSTHSVKTGAAIPNFFYISSDDEDFDGSIGTTERGLTGTIKLNGSASGAITPPSKFNTMDLHLDSPTPHVLRKYAPSGQGRSTVSNIPFISSRQDSNHHSSLQELQPSSHCWNPDTRQGLNIGALPQSSRIEPSSMLLDGQYNANKTVDLQISDNFGMPTQVIDEKVTIQVQRVSRYTARCSYCGECTIPCARPPQVLCSGCGPTSNVRYCSVACLLVDSMAHASVCMKYTAHRPAFHELPGHFIYIENPITSEAGYVESPERYRQRAFSMHCSSGPFPKLLMAWMKKSSALLSGTSSIDPNETIKRTGDYVIFRSGSTQAPPQNNPNADVIYT